MGLLKTAASTTGNIGCEILADGTELLLKLAQGWRWARETEVLVGIPIGQGAQAGSASNGGDISPAQLMYIHTNGSPAMHIPARPTIEPALSEAQTYQQTREYIKAGLDAAIRRGDTATAYKMYALAGQKGANAVQRYFGTGAPNAPITIHGGWMRNPVSGKPVYIKGKGSSTPLIDTGKLRKSITYVVRRKGKDIKG